MLINVPEYIDAILKRLSSLEYKCYLVGGCVRDSLLGLEIKDYDLSTNCSIEELKKIFNDYCIVNTNGEKHNTITLHIDNDNVEISSFKHSDDEENSLWFDLFHRDYTINAMAYDGELIDYYGGLEDLSKKIIKAVGEPQERINEDPLRILRALRFSSKLGYDIEENTKEAIHKNASKLRSVAPERIKKELDGILEGNNVKNILREYNDIIFVIIPELKPTYDFDQKNPYHQNTLYNHIVNVCSNCANDYLIRISALLHDVAKPLCQTIDDDGIGHYYGHPQKGSEMALEILKRLRFSNEEIEKICYLIKNHDSTINSTRKSVRRNFTHTPNQDKILFLKLIELINADRSDHTICELIDVKSIDKIVEEIIKDNDCIKLSDLKINGFDLLDLGFMGRKIGITLNLLLNEVIEGKIPNDKVSLLEYAKGLIK